MIVMHDVTKVHSQGETEVRALRGVSCKIEAGSFTFVVGPSGSGKSTLLYMIGALDEPTAGTIHFEGRNLAGFSHAQRDAFRQSDVGFVFQSFNLLGNLDAIDNVLVPFMPRGLSADMRRQAADLLSSVGLGHRLGHRPNQLSGGEQQRVAIARALFKQPRMVLADEPTGELDGETGREVFAHLRNLHAERKTTVVVVTHDHRHITTGDRVLELEDGKVVHTGHG